MSSSSSSITHHVLARVLRPALVLLLVALALRLGLLVLQLLVHGLVLALLPARLLLELGLPVHGRVQVLQLVLCARRADVVVPVLVELQPEAVVDVGCKSPNLSCATHAAPAA